MWIALVKVHNSSLRPFAYTNVSGTYAYITSDKLTCEYMSSLRHVDFCIPGDDSRPVRVRRELVEAEIHTCTNHRDSAGIVRAIRCQRRVLVGSSRLTPMCRLCAWVVLDGDRQLFLWVGAGSGIGFWQDGFGWICLGWTASYSNGLRSSMSP